MLPPPELDVCQPIPDVVEEQAEDIPVEQPDPAPGSSSSDNDESDSGASLEDALADADLEISSDAPQGSGSEADPAEGADNAGGELPEERERPGYTYYKVPGVGWLVLDHRTLSVGAHCRWHPDCRIH